MPLDASQQRAAEHLSGPALVLAGPGSGKTTTLVERFVRLVEQGVDPRSILTTTFTRAAADELRTRLEARGVLTRGLTLGTFHSLGMRLLRESDVARAVDVVPDFKILNSDQQYGVLRELDLHQHFDLEVLVEAIGRFKEGLVTPADVMREAKEAPASERDERVQMALAYQCYQDALWRAQRFDFSDLIMLTVRALQRDEDLRAAIASRFTHLMVDEFQDINAAQYALIEALLVDHENLWVVGDDDQAIYGWRGSDLRFMTGLAERFPDLVRFVLAHNYRSQPVVVRAAAALVRNNRGRLPKSQEAVRSEPIPIRLCEASDPTHEADWIARAIGVLLDHDVPLSEIAILVRTQHVMLPIEAALEKAGYPFEVRGGRSLWKLPEVRLLMDILGELAAGRRGHGGNMKWLREALRNMIVEDAERLKFEALLERLVEKVASSAPVSASQERRAQWSEAARAVGRVAAEEGGVEEAVARLRALARGPRRKTRAGEGVCLSTMHQAKGLEWRAVFVAGCEEALMPHAQAADEEEERRLFYVAATRARSFLSVSWSSFRGKKRAGRSPFVGELTRGVSPEEVAERRHPDRPSASPVREAARAAEQVRVWHHKLGYGQVVSVDDDRWTVRFVSAGLKKIKRRFLEVL